MQVYSIRTTDPNFTASKTNLAKKAARKAAGYSKKPAASTVTTDIKSFVQPLICATTTLVAQAVALPFAMTDAINKDWFRLGKNNIGEAFEPDVFQKAAGINLAKEEDVLVTAPTGTGKTAIAHFVISKNLEEGKRTLYTTPLKALSNQMIRDFKKIYGDENVGILTGDVKENKDAPIVIMTTEIYRNMVFNDYMKDNRYNSGLKDVRTVIFDEAHNLGDVDRGGIWEQSFMFTPPNVQILSLSATIGNNVIITDWIGSIRNNGSKYITFDKQKDINEESSAQITDGIKGVGTKNSVLINVPEENRHVPLEFHLYKGEISSYSHKKPKGKLSKAEKRKNEKAQATLNKSLSAQPSTATYCNIVDDLCEADRLPAILFIFSKNRSERVLNALKSNCECLNDREEINQIRETIKRYEQDGKYLGEGLDKEALYRGYAIHNAGMLPVQKELIEELANRKLIKVVIATETLSAGINIPARTTVLSAVRKPSDHPDGEDGMRDVTNSEGKQIWGRAGRRGKDVKGFCYGIACTNAQANRLKDIFYGKPNKLKSSFIPDYSFLANYYNICDTDEKLEKMMAKSLYIYDKKPEVRATKQANLFAEIQKKKDILKSMEFLNEDNSLTDKGLLLQHINGYVQLPIVELVHDGTLSELNPVQLAGFVGALANMEKKHRENENEEIRDGSELQIQDKFLKSRIQHLKEILSDYTSITGDIIDVDTDVAQNIYRFAELNSVKNSNSIENWSFMYNFDVQSAFEFEGQLFRQITTTIDLLKQLYTMVDAEYASREDTSEEAALLKANIMDAIDLINREPAKI